MLEALIELVGPTKTYSSVHLVLFVFVLIFFRTLYDRSIDCNPAAFVYTTNQLIGSTLFSKQDTSGFNMVIIFMLNPDTAHIIMRKQTLIGCLSPLPDVTIV